MSDVTFTEIDGALAIVPDGTADVAVVIGPATAGPLNTPAAFANVADIVATYTSGPMVSCAAYLLRTPGRAVVVCRCDTSTDGAYGTVRHTGVTGGCVPSAHAATKPYDAYDAYVVIVTGGTVGVDGITYQTSLDGGRTLLPVTALGTSTTITITAGNVAFDLTASTLVAGDYFECRTTAPLEDTNDLTDAFAAVKATSLEWDGFVLANPQPLANLQLCDTTLRAWTAEDIDRTGMANARVPTVSETEADYYAAMAIVAAGIASTHLTVGAGACRTISGLDGSQEDRPAIWAAAARAYSNLIVDSAATSIAQVSLGPLPSDVALRDVNGNLVHHDERLNPGLDALGFLTLRTFASRQRKGVYIKKDRIMCAAGSDFTRRTYRICINRAKDALRTYLEGRLEAPLQVSATTGYILKSEANDIIEGALSVMKTAIGQTPACSAYTFTVVMTDNVLSTSQLRCSARIVPLFYPSSIGVTIGFTNPAAGVAA